MNPEHSFGCDYYPFGMLMPNRYTGSSDYRYAWNGAEKDDEVFGTQGTNYDLGARTYDARIGRMRSTDPWEAKYPWQSSYVYYANSPISKIDWKGYGDNDWTPNGDGTWTAEAGDGAESLAKDAGISREKAYSLLENQGMGTYEDQDDCIIKSAVDIGDKVMVNDISKPKSVAKNIPGVNVPQVVPPGPATDELDLSPVATTFSMVNTFSLVMDASYVSTSGQVFKASADGLTAAELTAYMAKNSLKMSKVFTRLNVATGVITTVYSFHKIYSDANDPNKEVDPWDVADAGAGTLALGGSAMIAFGTANCWNPVGWTIGGVTAVYFIYRAVTDE